MTTKKYGLDTTNVRVKRSDMTELEALKVHHRQPLAEVIHNLIAEHRAKISPNKAGNGNIHIRTLATYKSSESELLCALSA